MLFQGVLSRGEGGAKRSRRARGRREPRGSRARGAPAGVRELSGGGKMGLYAGPLGVGEIGLWYALLIMPGILPGYRFTTPFQTVTTAYCVDIDPHEPCMYEWLS